VQTAVTSQTTGLLAIQGMRVIPSGCLPFIMFFAKESKSCEMLWLIALFSQLVNQKLISARPISIPGDTRIIIIWQNILKH